MDVAVAVLMIVMGVAIAGTWTRDIVAGDQVDLTQGLFAARDPDDGRLFWPHWLAEYATAAALIAAGVGLTLDADWGGVLGALATGALIYTSTNSLGWAFARRDRLGYAFSMLAGVAVGVFVAIYLLVR